MDSDTDKRLRALEVLVGMLLTYRSDKDQNQNMANGFSFSGTLAAMLRQHSDPAEPALAQWLSDLVRTAPVMGLQEEARRGLAMTNTRIGDLEDVVASYLTAASLGVDAKDLMLPRFLPVRVWVGEDDVRKAATIREAVEGLIAAFDFVQYTKTASERGSWWYRWIARSQRALNQPEVAQRLEQIERALQLQALNKPQADVDEKQANAAARLIEALRATPNAACQVGSVLVVKTTDQLYGERIVVRTLTQRQIMAIEKDDRLLADPAGIIKRLDSLQDGIDTEANT